LCFSVKPDTLENHAFTYFVISLYASLILTVYLPGNVSVHTIITPEKIMKKHFFLIIFIVHFSVVFSQDNIPEIFSVDDKYFQEYNGKIGRWVLVADNKKLMAYIKELGASDADVNRLNPDMKTNNRYVFIPYSEAYMNALDEKGIRRTYFSAAPDAYIWPVMTVMNISSPFGYRGKTFHTGIDLPAERGSIVCATMEGQVSFAGYESGYGNMVDVQHCGNFITRYGHNTAILVRKGDFVKKGQVIALAGSTGNSTGCHVHYEIRCNDIPLDPLDYLPVSSKVRIVHPLNNWKQKR
jgi:murein DD-endopeptidase MepM/ murein hydrolase activator NlpD